MIEKVSLPQPDNGESCVVIGSLSVLFPSFPPSSQPMVNLVDTAAGEASRCFRNPLS